MLAAAMPWFQAALAVIVPLWLVSIGMLAYRSRGVIRGWSGEARVRYFHLRRLPRADYTVFHDVYLPRPDSTDTTQIDHIVVSRFGVFVIETKNISGWLYGSAEDPKWTVTYRSGGMRRFQNPRRQNDLHVAAVVKFLDLGSSAVRSLVFLVGSAEPKTFNDMGDNVLHRYGLAEHILQQRTEVLIPDTERRCVALLREHVAGMDRATLRKTHIAQLQRRHSGSA